MATEHTSSTIVERPPVVVVMGHIDHGKSTLLDYIRKTNIVDKEAGGITQHLSGYEFVHKTKEGKEQKITFLDTPGHEAFSHMRERGAKTADIAILVVSAEDGVKAQTLEALKSINESKLSLIVAINKIDKPGANIEKVKMDLAEKGVYLEGYGGDIPYAEISAKQGLNIDHLLDLILLVAEIAELKADIAKGATGVVIESHLDGKRGITATLIIKDGTLRKGMTIVAGDAQVGTRIVEDFLGKAIENATVSSPIRVTGFDKMPVVGSVFQAYENKKDAEKAITAYRQQKENQKNIGPKEYALDTVVIPLIIKTDVAGTGDAVEKEVRKLELPNVQFKILDRSVGMIGEADVQLANSDKTAIIVGFNTRLDARARDLNEKLGVKIEVFDIIYKLSDFLKTEVEIRKPRVETIEVSGKARVLKIFNGTRDRQVIGGKILEGVITSGNDIKIIRRDFEVGRGKIIGLERNKVKTKEIEEGAECGMLIEAKTEIAPSDIIEAVKIVYS